MRYDKGKCPFPSVIHNNMKSKTLFHLLPLLLGFFVMGFCDIVGFLSDYVQRAFQWSDVLTGFVPSMVFIWFLFFSIPAGNVMNRIGRKTTVMVSLALTIVGMVLPLITYTTISCMMAFALLGIGNAILQVSLNPLLGNVLTDNRYLTSGLTAGQVVKALSSLFGPEIAVLVVTRYGDDRWYYCFPVLGAITVVTAVWLWLTPIKREQGSGTKLAFRDTFRLLSDRMVLLLFLGILMVVGLDVSVNYMGSKLMSARFLWDSADCKYAPQTYFLLRTIGAMLGSVLLTRIDAVRYFRVNIVLCVASIVGLILSESASLTIVCFGCIGFFASSVFSIIYSVAMQHRPKHANEISGLMVTAISGGAIVTPVVGYSISIVGVVGGLYIVLACALYLLVCAFAVKHT